MADIWFGDTFLGSMGQPVGEPFTLTLQDDPGGLLAYQWERERVDGREFFQRMIDADPSRAARFARAKAALAAQIARPRYARRRSLRDAVRRAVARGRA